MTPNGKIEFLQELSTYIDLTPANANVMYIEGEIQKRWGVEYILVTNDGLRLSDSSATRG